MSREWKRVPTTCYCGYCGTDRLIVKGEPALFVTLPGVKRARVRCQSCAGEPPPDDLPPLLISGGIEKTTLIRAKYQYKNEDRTEWMPYREPGCDDD